MDTAADRAASGIRALIVAGEYESGTRLPSERELAQQLEVSRPALREGIRRLRSGGVLESRRGSGTYVAEIDAQAVYDVRVRLEPLAAQWAALRRTDAEFTEMRRLVTLMRDRIDEPETFNHSDAQFHNLVARASRSPVLIGTLDRLGELALLTRTAIVNERRLRVSSLGDVERVCQAIERKHPKRAANAMERHIVNVRADYMAVQEKDASRDGRRRRRSAIKTGDRS
ncbi:MAG TPA: FCD domain-containing protein [Thermoleophilaceae bacterium]|nr:FCD domain-containing protein [Thermoleophilaceae bacterium]